MLVRDVAEQHETWACEDLIGWWLKVYCSIAHSFFVIWVRNESEISVREVPDWLIERFNRFDLCEGNILKNSWPYHQFSFLVADEFQQAVRGSCIQNSDFVHFHAGLR